MVRAADSTGLHRFAVDEYHRMADVGILGEGERVELIFGVIREMSPSNRPHVIATSLTRQLFSHGLAGRASVYAHSPLYLDAVVSEPEPDVAIYSNPDVDAFGTAATEPLLAIEVADSSVNFDLTTKAELYAEGASSRVLGLGRSTSCAPRLSRSKRRRLSDAYDTRTGLAHRAGVVAGFRDRRGFAFPAEAASSSQN